MYFVLSKNGKFKRSKKPYSISQLNSADNQGHENGFCR